MFILSAEEGAGMFDGVGIWYLYVYYKNRVYSNVYT
jgi:hypothetical protein